MGNRSVKHKRSSGKRSSGKRSSGKRSSGKRSSGKRSSRGGMRSPPKEDASPRTIIRQKMRSSVTRRQKETKANSETLFGSMLPSKSKTRRKETPLRETIMEEEEEWWAYKPIIYV